MRLATHSAVSPCAADGCIAAMMRKPNGARLTSDAALLLSYVIRLLVRHDLDRQGRPSRAIAFARSERPHGRRVSWQTPQRLRR